MTKNMRVENKIIGILNNKAILPIALFVIYIILFVFSAIYMFL